MDTQLINAIKRQYRIVGNSDGLNRALEVALKIAHVDLSVLILGENGVGKEVFPRIIHDNSTRKRKNYFAVNCGAIPEGTIDSELFGHTRGAFTGAVADREGYFSVANGGTLFLDEVGELPLSTQARLLRVLETGEYIPVGSSEVKRTDVRIVAATNLDMDKAIAEGRFRQDLYYRLNTISVAVPPLRERGRDIDLLFRHFAMEMGEKYRIPDVVRLDAEATQLLMNYSWPGNVRQLRNLAENLSVVSENRLITAPVLAQYLPEPRASRAMTIQGEAHEGLYSYEEERVTIFKMLFSLRKEVEDLKRGMMPSQTHDGADVLPNPATSLPFKQTTAEDDVQIAEEVSDDKQQMTMTTSIGEAERKLIIDALERNDGRRRLAAAELGISERTLYRKIREYGLE